MDMHVGLSFYYVLINRYLDIACILKASLCKRLA
jgi:hypothetical protein